MVWNGRDGEEDRGGKYREGESYGECDMKRVVWILRCWEGGMEEGVEREVSGR